MTNNAPQARFFCGINEPEAKLLNQFWVLCPIDAECKSFITIYRSGPSLLNEFINQRIDKLINKSINSLLN